MILGPTLNGGLKLVPEDEPDWLVLLAIAADGSDDLANQFAGLMDEDSMWEEIVVPELQAEFSTQRAYILKVIKKTRRSESAEIVIGREDADHWYGALNQARLALESRFKFGPREYAGPEEFEDPKKRSAFLRDEFYQTVQSLILTYVFPDA